MTTLRVYAHHGPIPRGFPTPPSIAQLPQPDQPQPIAEYWCELVLQSAVDNPGEAEPGYGQAGAVDPDQWRWDLGYPSGYDFSVGRVCVLLVGATAQNFDYVLVSPYGQRISAPTGLVSDPMAPLPDSGNPSAPYEGLQACWEVSPAVMLGVGIWRVEVFPKEGVEVTPTESAWTNGVSNVQLGPAETDGFLAIEFTGDPVTTLPTTPAPTTTTTTTTPAPTTT